MVALQSRHINVIELCYMCRELVKTIEHVLLSCIFSFGIWNSLLQSFHDNDYDNTLYIALSFWQDFSTFGVLLRSWIKLFMLADCYGIIAISTNMNRIVAQGVACL